MELYRYQPINKFTIENLIHKKNWASCVRYFNDPFEFSLRSNVSITKEGRIEYLSPEKNKIREGVQQHISNLGVVSYSDNLTNNLLWSHYTNNHTGMCLVFKVKEELNNKAIRVNYQNLIPDIEFEDTINLIPLLTTKSVFWGYENEFRQIFREGQKHYDYPGELIKIVFGCRTSIKDIETIYKIIEYVYNEKMAIGKMFIQEDTFQLYENIHKFDKEMEIPKWFVNDKK